MVSYRQGFDTYRPVQSEVQMIGKGSYGQTAYHGYNYKPSDLEKLEGQNSKMEWVMG